MKTIECPQCGGWGGEPGANFGDTGWHPCFRCGTSGRVPEVQLVPEPEPAPPKAFRVLTPRVHYDNFDVPHYSWFLADQFDDLGEARAYRDYISEDWYDAPAPRIIDVNGNDVYDTLPEPTNSFADGEIPF